jgi:hypothetical protein
MSTGDVLAQQVEKSRGAEWNIADAEYYYVGDQDLSSSSRREEIWNRLFNAQQYEMLGDYNDENDEEDRWTFSMSSSPKSSTVSSAVSSIVDDIQQRAKDGCNQLNIFRTTTMASWVIFYVPFYATLYKLYDRYLPKQTPGGIVARVGLSFVCSIPVNAVFYTYGTTIHHTKDWYSKLQQQHTNNNNTTRDLVQSYRSDILLEKIQRKITTELPTTIQTSGACWIPINLVTFSLVPSHLQPLSLMFFSLFWNCYLSMSQHRKHDDDENDHHDD